MKMRLSQLRATIRALLAESDSIEDTRRLAAWVNVTGTYALVYTPPDPVEMARLLDKWDSKKFASKYVVAAVRIKAPKEPCAGADEVSMIVGPGHGKLIYGVAYALSRHGRLTPSRPARTGQMGGGSLSADAVGAWKRVWDSGRARVEFVSPHSSQAKTDPDDVCSLWNEDALDAAYEAEGWEEAALAEMMENHDAFFEALLEVSDDSDDVEDLKSNFEYALTRSGEVAFDMKYKGAVLEGACLIESVRSDWETALDRLDAAPGEPPPGVLTNSQGEGVLFYHGTRRQFTEFSREFENTSGTSVPTNYLGFYFTTSPGVAQIYASRRFSLELGPARGGHVDAYHLAALNPYFITERSYWRMTRGSAGEMSDLVTSLSARGHDSIVMPSVWRGSGRGAFDVVVFDPDAVIRAGA